VSLLVLLAVANLQPTGQEGTSGANSDYTFAPPPRTQWRNPIAPEHLRLAQRLAELIVISEIRDEVLLFPPAPQQGNGNSTIQARRSARWNVASAAATAYARLYSADELRSMISFFESPAGQKYLSARRQGVVDVTHVFRQLPWYPELFYEVCGDRAACRWAPPE
jgi:hypothetical protein